MNTRNRLQEHRRSLKKGTHHNNKLQHAFAKYGEGAFSFDTIILCATKDLIFYEQRVMDGFSSVTNGYNLRPLAESNRGHKHTAEVRARASIERKSRGAEFRAKISATSLGRKISAEACAKRGEARRGIKLTLEHRAKLSAAHLGKKRGPMSLEQRKKLSDIKRGRIGMHSHSEETKKKIGLAQIGNTHRVGKTLTAEHKRSIVAANTGRVFSEDLRRKMSDARKGQHPSAETRKRMSESAKKRHASGKMIGATAE